MFSFVIAFFMNGLLVAVGLGWTLDRAVWVRVVSPALVFVGKTLNSHIVFSKYGQG